MSKALISFLYKAADSRQDALAFGGGGAGLGAIAGGLMARDGEAASGAGLGALAGGALGSLYGMNKDTLNGLASNIFTTKDRGNPITTGIGAGVLGAGGLALKNNLMQSDLPDTFKEHAAGGPAQHHEMLAALGDVPEGNKQKMLAALAAEEDRRVAGILGGSIKTNPIHDNFLKMLQLHDKSKVWADTLARRLAVKQIMEDPSFLESIKKNIGVGDAAASANFAADKSSIQSALNKAKGRQVILDAVAPGKGAKPTDPVIPHPQLPAKIQTNMDLKQYSGRNGSLVERLMEKMKGLEAPKTGIPDTAGLLKHMKGVKPRPGAWGRYGVAGLGAGALGMMLAGLENKIRS